MTTPDQAKQSQEAHGLANPKSTLGTRPARAIGRVLESPELLRTIFDVLEPGRISDNDDREQIAIRNVKKATLAACARVSRHFSQHALDVLWFSLDENVGALLRILPSIQWIDRQTMITGEITSAEWAHFRTFAVRVREMSYQPAGIGPLVWTILARKCQDEPLLPRLRLIDAYDMREGDISMMTCILTPSLLSVNLHFDAPRDPPSRSLLCAGMKVLLQTLVDTAPGLTELCWDSPCDRRFGMGFLTRIGGLRSLRALTLTQRETSLELPIHVPTTLFQALAGNPQLRSLTLDLGRMELEPGMKVGATLALEELRTLCVRGGPTETITTLVHSLRVPALRSLEVDHAFMYQVPFAALQDQLSKLCANLPPTLQSFMWVNLGNPTPTVDVTAPSDISCVLGPLLRFTYLRNISFTISATSWLHTTDDGLAELAAAWPNIQVLWVTLHDSTARVSVNNTHPTIAALVTFAQRCPVLWSLSLPSLDFSSVHPTVFVPLIPRHPLSRLSISTAVCGGASAVQAVVSLAIVSDEVARYAREHTGCIRVERAGFIRVEHAGCI